MKYDTSHPSAQAGIRHYQNRDYVGASACFAVWVAAEPNNAAAWNLLGLVQCGLGKPQQALESYDRALQVDPTDTAAISHKGRCLASLGAHREAITWLEKFLAAQPNSADDLDCLASCHLAQGHYAEALHHYDRA